MKTLLMSAVVALVAAGAAQAQSLDAIKERAAFLQEYKSLLNSDDPTIQRAALDEGLKSGDGVVRKFAMDFALSSEDKALQTQALAAYLASLPTVLVNFEVSEESSEKQAALAKSWTPMSVGVEAFDAKTNQFSGRTSSGTYKLVGRVVESGFEFTASRTSVSVTLASPTLLVGVARNEATEVPVSVVLQ